MIKRLLTKKNVIFYLTIILLILNISLVFSSISGLLCPYCLEENVDVLNNKYGICQCNSCNQYFLVVKGKVLTQDGDSQSLNDMVVPITAEEVAQLINGSSSASSSSSGSSSSSSSSSSSDNQAVEDVDNTKYDDEPTYDEFIESLLAEQNVKVSSNSIVDTYSYVSNDYDEASSSVIDLEPGDQSLDTIDSTTNNKVLVVLSIICGLVVLCTILYKYKFINFIKSNKKIRKSKIKNYKKKKAKNVKKMSKKKRR